MLLSTALTANEKNKAACRDYSPNQNCSRTFEYVGHAAVPPISGIATPPQNPKPERDQWRSEQDLQAQWDMARWTAWAAIASCISLFMTAAGIILVKLTLDANRNAVTAAFDAVNVARETAETQLRAYLSVDFRSEVAAPNYLIQQFVITPFFKNTGQTPARECQVWSDHALIPNDRPPNFSRTIPQTEAPRSTGSIGAGEARGAPGRTITWDDYSQILRKEKFLYIWMYCEYRDVFGEPRHTEQCAIVEIHSIIDNQTVTPEILARPHGPFFRFRSIGDQVSES